MLANHKPIVVVGSINTDLVAGAAQFPREAKRTWQQLCYSPARKGANQAVAVSRLGYPVQLIGKVGADVFGEQSRNYLQSAGVDVSDVEVGSGSSGVAIIAVSPAGDNSIIVVPGANAQVSPDFIHAHQEMYAARELYLRNWRYPSKACNTCLSCVG